MWGRYDRLKLIFTASARTGLLLLGTGEAAITFLSLSQNDVTYARTEWSALLSMLLAAPASVLYVLHRGAQSSWRRSLLDGWSHRVSPAFLVCCIRNI